MRAALCCVVAVHGLRVRVAVTTKADLARVWFAVVVCGASSSVSLAAAAAGAARFAQRVAGCSNGSRLDGTRRYTKLADWSYIDKCAQLSSIPLIGNGDICSWQDYWHRIETTKASAA